MSALQSKVNVRPARRADAATIAVYNIRLAMETESIRLDPATVERGVNAVFDDDSRGRYFVAECDGIVVGCLMLTHEWSDWRDGDIWWFQSVYVHDDYRGRGVFRAMYTRVLAEARAADVRMLRLYVEKHNDRAKQTYASLGMTLSEYEVMEAGVGTGV